MLPCDRRRDTPHLYHILNRYKHSHTVCWCNSCLVGNLSSRHILGDIHFADHLSSREGMNKWHDCWQHYIVHSNHKDLGCKVCLKVHLERNTELTDFQSDLVHRSTQDGVFQLCSMHLLLNRNGVSNAIVNYKNFVFVLPPQEPGHGSRHLKLIQASWLPQSSSTRHS